VEQVLGQLGIAQENAILEAWNKTDLLDDEMRIRLSNLATRRPAGDRPVLVSALSGEGIEQLAAQIETRLAQRRITLNLVIPASDGAGLSWLYRHAEVITKQLRDDGQVVIVARTDPANADKARAKFDGEAH
jgi:GTP-binding protein HflX